jgi:hypothetical protein
MAELNIVLLYIWSCVWRIIYTMELSVVNVQTPRRPFPRDIRQWKVLDIASMRCWGHCLCTWHPWPYGMFVVPVGVTVLLGLHNPPRSWTGTVGPSLPGFTIAPYVDSLLCYRSIRQPKYILQGSPEVQGTYMHFTYLHISCLTVT